VATRGAWKYCMRKDLYLSPTSSETCLMATLYGLSRRSHKTLILLEVHVKQGNARKGGRTDNCEKGSGTVR
jgi:hypothetical protein